jgi:tetratricopeptide (TPR) repeat protein
LTICPNCSTEQPTDDTKFCGFCGGGLPQKYNADEIDESTDFKVSESLDNGIEFLNSEKKSIESMDDDLGIKSNADLLDTGAISQDNPSTEEEDDGLIGQSWPPVASYLEQFENDNDKSNLPEKIEKPELIYDPKIELNERKELENKLFNFEMNNEKPPVHISPTEDKEHNEEIPKVEPEKVADIKPANKISPETPIIKPKMKPKSRGIAYFYKNFIELVGKQPLYAEDEVSVNNRIYILKPKRVRPSFLYGGISIIVVLVLFFIGSLFVEDTSGYGNIVGFALDDYDQPYTEGAIIKFSDLGTEVTTNPRGFFQLDDVPAGPTRIEYIVDDEIIKIDYVTVTSDNTSTILLFPELDNSTYSSQSTNKNQTTSEQTYYNSANNSKKNTASKTSSRYETSKIILSANVDNARLAIDNKIIGAGNITYSNISPGVHSYKVSQDGYNDVDGSFHVNSGETKRLVITLVPLQSKSKESTYKAEDFYYSAKNLIADAKFDEAIDNYSKALQVDPSYVKAVVGRAEAYDLINDSQSAHDDYIRAAEIYQINGNFIKSQTTYGNAIRSNPKSVTAYLGRANLFLNNKEYRAALGDFDKVTKLDRRNFDAYYGMGVTTYNQRRYKSAINHFKDARSINDKNPLVYQYLMLSYMYLNDNKNLKKSYSKFMDTASEEQLAEFQKSGNFSTIERLIN